MTVSSNVNAAITDLKADLDSRNFLDPGSKTYVDQSFIDDVQRVMDDLVTDYSATFEGVFDGDDIGVIEARAMAHWVFDGCDHQLKLTVYPDSSKGLVFVTDVPFPWRS